MNLVSGIDMKMKLRYIYVILFITVFSTGLFAQPSANDRNKDSYFWMFGIGSNFVDDDGSSFTNFFNIKDSWHSITLPSRITADKYFYNGWSFEGALAFNKYDSRKIVNLETGHEGFFMSADVNMKYSFMRLFYPMQVIDPFVSSGFGITYRQALDGLMNTNLNVCAGLNIWITDYVGVHLQTSGKIALVSDIIKTNKDYMQHTFGLVFKIKEPSITRSGFHKSRYKVKYRDKKKKKKKKNGKSSKQ